MSYHRRIKFRGEQAEVAGFHCVARVARRMHLLGDPAKEQLVKSMHRVAGFSGVELLGYCVLSNHFHVLVRVDPGAKQVDDAVLVKRFRILYGRTRAQGLRMDADELRALLSDPLRAEAAEQVREQLRARMGDISAFMQTLKQRYTKWFNRTCGGSGTLWAERFRSVLLQDNPATLRMVAAYIDLNPVRAGLVDDPMDYRWCGYAAAVAANTTLRRSYAGFFPQATNAPAALANYRLMMLGKGRVAKRDGSGSCVPREVIEEAQAHQGHLPAHRLLSVRARYFTDGLALGAADWVARICGPSGLLRYKRRRTPKPVPSPTGEAFACARQWSHQPLLQEPEN